MKPVAVAVILSSTIPIQEKVRLFEDIVQRGELDRKMARKTKTMIKNIDYLHNTGELDTSEWQDLTHRVYLIQDALIDRFDLDPVVFMDSM